jgi:hypothetical protein
VKHRSDKGNIHRVHNGKPAESLEQATMQAIKAFYADIAKRGK